MILTLSHIRGWAKHCVAVLGLIAATVGASAHAGNVGISGGIHVPGAAVYGVHPAPPHHVHPRARHYHPAPPSVVYYAPAPSHGYWVPPSHGKGKHNKRHKHRHHHKHKHHHHGHR